MRRYVTRSADETRALGQALGAHLIPGDVALIRGELGAGKSVLARGVAAGLGVTCAMPSPTFTLMRPYRGRCPVYHFDLYRLSGADEFYAAGLSDFVGGDGVALVEWPEAGELNPPSHLALDIARGEGDEERLIRMEARGMDGGRLCALAAALTAWEAHA